MSMKGENAEFEDEIEFVEADAGKCFLHAYAAFNVIGCKRTVAHSYGLTKGVGEGFTVRKDRIVSGKVLKCISGNHLGYRGLLSFGIKCHRTGYLRHESSRYTMPISLFEMIKSAGRDPGSLRPVGL